MRIRLPGWYLRIIVKTVRNHQTINILDRLECFHERKKLATEVEHSESQYQQRNSLHCCGYVPVNGKATCVVTACLTFRGAPVMSQHTVARGSVCTAPQ